MAARKIKILGLLGVLMLTGCPYSEGCEAAPAITGVDGGNNGDGGPGPGEDGGPNPEGGEEEAPIPLGPIEPRCKGYTTMCGGMDCCAVGDVPGGTFNRLNDPAFPATVSAFKLDIFEVTVARFRSFVNAGFGIQKNPPAIGAGQHPTAPNAALTGWRDMYKPLLAEDTEALHGAVASCPLYVPYNRRPGVNDTLPMNCVSWAVAFAFCVWDGGRLPTETEWNYAAAGGNEQRVYPWGNVFNKDSLTFGCRSGTSTADPGAPECTMANYLGVGTHPAGKGRWGHQDMAGSVWERVLDQWAHPLSLATCNNCVDIDPPTAAETRNNPIRGGSLNWAQRFQTTTFHDVEEAPDGGLVLDPSEGKADTTNTVGFRCARDK